MHFCQSTKPSNFPLRGKFGQLSKRKRECFTGLSQYYLFIPVVVGRGRAQRRGHSHRLLLLSQGAALQCSLPGGVGRAVGQGWGAQGARLKGNTGIIECQPVWRSRSRFFGRSEPGAEAAFFKKWWRKRRSIF